MADDGATIEKLLRYKTWAMVGLTPSPFRTSYQMADFLGRHGITVIPVNPAGEAVLGVDGARSLADLPAPPDVVAVYRRTEAAGEFVDEAVRIGAKAVWTPLDVTPVEAATRAEKAGLDVVMDRCPKIEWPAHGPRD